jgi:hypothetical protein
MLCALFRFEFGWAIVGEVENRAWSAVRSFGEGSLCSELRERFRMFDPRLRVNGLIFAVSGVWFSSFAALGLLGAATVVCGDMSKFPKGEGGGWIKFASLSDPHTFSCAGVQGKVFTKILLSETHV